MVIECITAYYHNDIHFYLVVYSVSLLNVRMHVTVQKDSKQDDYLYFITFEPLNDSEDVDVAYMNKNEQFQMVVMV